MSNSNLRIFYCNSGSYIYLTITEKQRNLNLMLTKTLAANALEGCSMEDTDAVGRQRPFNLGNELLRVKRMVEDVGELDKNAKN